VFPARLSIEENVMSADSTPTRRSILATSAAAGVAGLLNAGLSAAAEGDVIRPFRINVPEAELTEMRRRIGTTRWPDRETVTDESQGVQLATMQDLALGGTGS